MNKIFISYRRKESADFTGRLFDRLAGYFGPDSVFMDVDVLISGADYRTQIGKIIAECDVLLAIIGQEWTTITDESGKRRLDNPDDQLRIEVATALERGIAVVPVLIHGAGLPNADELPADIAAIATAEPIGIQSGLPFNTDVQKLVDRLEQKHALRHPDRRFPLELVLIPLGILLVVGGCLGLINIPYCDSYVQARLSPGYGPPDMDYSLAGYRAVLQNMILFCTIPLGLGPLLIVLGTRWCCLHKESGRERLHFSSGIGRRPPPKSGKAVLCLGFGLASIGLGVVAAIPAIVLGIWAFLDIRQRTGWVRGRSLAVTGLIAAVVGGSATTYLHVSYWRFHGWLQYVEQAEQALATGNADAALWAYQQSIDANPGGALGVGVSHIKRAEVYLQTNRLPSAVEELTAVITRFQSAVSNPYDRSARDVLRDAYGLRADAYDALGERDKADEDRRLQQGVESDLVVPDGSDTMDYFREEAAPPAPAPEAPLPAPAPANGAS
jgi:hypothetical protein